MKHKEVINGIDRLEKIHNWYKNECDGTGPHGGIDNQHVETRIYPIGGGGNLILCWKCFVKENRYNYERGRETKTPENFKQVNFYNAEIYNNMREE